LTLEHFTFKHDTTISAIVHRFIFLFHWN